MVHNWYKEQRTGTGKGKECMGKTKEKIEGGGRETKERREVRFSPSHKFLVYPSDWGESASVYSHPGKGGKVSSQNFDTDLTNYSARYQR